MAVDTKILANILLVEDDLTLSKMYQEAFTHLDFNCRVAPDGGAGIAYALETHPDLILLDLALPKMDGMTVMKQLRQDAWGKTVPIIILTNLNPNDEILKGVVSGQPSYYLVKANTTPDEVIAKVKEVLQIA